MRVLVPYEKLDRLEYDEGLHLYDEAIGALPHPDKTLVHHKGLWVKNKGQWQIVNHQSTGLPAKH